MMPLRIGESASKAAICLVALLAPAMLRADDAEPRINASVSPNPVPEHESLQFRVEVQSPLQLPVFEPSFDAPDFTVVGKGMSTEIVSINGDAHKTTAFTFVLMPKRSGEFTIRAIEVKAGGKPLRAPTLHVNVSPDSGGAAQLANPSAPSRGRSRGGEDEEESSNPAAPNYSGNPAPGLGSVPGHSPSAPSGTPTRFNSDFTLWASPHKTRAYVGEPIVVDYYLYDFGGLRQTEVQQWPTFTGFWREDLHLATQVAFESIYLHNQEMRRAFIARYALYGIKPGRYPIDKLTMRGRYVANDINSPFFGMDLRTGIHASQDLNVEILPLPEKGRPANFSGAVGKFQLKLEADKQKLPQNTPVTFTLTLTGAGNFQAVDSIKLPLPPDFEIYESSSSGRGSNPVGMRRELDSQKTFQTIAIPRKAGKFELPAVSWVYFNPEKEAYETLSTNSMTIEVTENAVGATGANTYLKPAEGGKTAAALPQELRFLKPVALEHSAPLAASLKWPLWALLALNLVLLARWTLSKTQGISGLVKGMDPFAPARFALLRSKGKDVEWQAELEEVLMICMQVLLETNPRGLTKQSLEELWKARSLPDPLFQRINAVLEEIDRHRFSSQKLRGAGSRDLRIRIIREAEGIIAESSKLKRKAGS